VVATEVLFGVAVAVPGVIKKMALVQFLTVAVVPVLVAVALFLAEPESLVLFTFWSLADEHN
jgi:hypothetical protein